MIHLLNKTEGFYGKFIAEHVDYLMAAIIHVFYLDNLKINLRRNLMAKIWSIS